MAEFPVEAVVDLSAIRFNLNAIRKRVGPGVKIAACVKANAYGHGFEGVTRALVDENIDMLCVSCAKEALDARSITARTPILIFGGFFDHELRECIEARAQLTVCSVQDVKRIEKAAGRAEVGVHVNVDTGMGRVGTFPEDAEKVIKAVAESRSCRLEGVYTHFPSSDEAELSFSLAQLEKFRAVVEGVQAKGIRPKYVHTANSGAILSLEGSFFNMVRAGISLYGYYPSEDAARSVELKPSMALETHVLAVRRLRPGDTVSYGRTFIARREMTTAVLAVGYGDGFPRGLSNKGKVLVRGSAVPIVGRVCMDLTIVDVTNVEDVSVGDNAIVYSPVREDPNSIEATASLLGTIPNEIVCALTSRVRRTHLDGFS